jgi:menaquinol-cytochrome c reductase iron-sulfur subunit
MADDDAEPKRRTFLAVAAAGGCVIAGAVAVPALGFVGAPAAAAGPTGLRFAIGKLEDLEVGVPKKFAIIGDQVDAWTRAPKRKLGSVWVERLNEKEVRAFNVTCPHLGCAIDVVADPGGKATGFNCACHDSNFELTGKRGEGPSPRDMDPVPAEVGSDGTVTITFKRFRIGTEAREEVG